MGNRRQDDLFVIPLDPQAPEWPQGDVGKPVGLVGKGGAMGWARAGAFIFLGVAHGKGRENEFQMMGQSSRLETRSLHPVGRMRPWK